MCDVKPLRYKGETNELPGLSFYLHLYALLGLPRGERVDVLPSSQVRGSSWLVVLLVVRCLLFFEFSPCEFPGQWLAL
jgi:hypothetical protein